MSEEIVKDNPYTLFSSYEYVKQNILLLWFDVQKEYLKYIRITSQGKIYPSETLSSRIMVLYKTMLRPKVMRFKNKYADLLLYLDSLKNMEIETNKINWVIDQITLFMEDSGLTRIGAENIPFDIKFSRGYGA